MLLTQKDYFLSSGGGLKFVNEIYDELFIESEAFGDDVELCCWFASRSVSTTSWNSFKLRIITAGNILSDYLYIPADIYRGTRVC